MGVAAFLLLILQPTWLVREEASSALFPPLEWGQQAVDNSYCTKSCSRCKSVYCSQVMLKINSQQQHQQEALTDCLMCWHSYKFLDKKSNTLSLFSSPYTSKLLLRESKKRVWDCECHCAGEISGSGVHGFGREKNADPGFERKWGGELLTQPQLHWSQWLFFLQEYFPLGQASGARVGIGVELFVYLLSSKNVPSITAFVRHK